MLYRGTAQLYPNLRAGCYGADEWALGTQRCRDRTWHGHLTAATLGLGLHLGLASLMARAPPASAQESCWKAAAGWQPGNVQSWLCGAADFAHPAGPGAGCRQRAVCQPCQCVGCDGHAATSPALRRGIKQRGSNESVAGSLIRHYQQPWVTALHASSSKAAVPVPPLLHGRRAVGRRVLGQGVLLPSLSLQI